MESLRKVVLGIALAAAACGRARPPFGDAVRISVPHDVVELDPHARNQLASFAIVSQIYEPLVTTDASMQIQPCLASRWENPDPSTWVFHLRENVRFHDGKLFDASDVVYTIDRLLRTPGLEMTGYLLYIDSVVAVDRHTVRIRTTKPLAVLLNKLRFIPIVPKGATREVLDRHPDGTGAYRLAEWSPGKLLRVVRNDAYWGPRPPIREATFRLDRSPDQALSDLLAGRADMVQCNSKRLAAALAGSSRYRTFRRTSIFVKYLGYDLAHDDPGGVEPRPNPFKNRLVREAMNVAIDRRRLIAALPYDAVPATQLVPPFIFGFNPRIGEAAFDPARARALLAQAGLADGITAPFLTRKLFAEPAAIVAAQLRDVGIRVDVRVVSDPDFFAIANAGRSPLHLSRFGCLTGDISDILDNVLHSLDSERHFGIHNYVGYSNPDVDRAIEASAEMQGINARRDALQNVEKTLMDDLVWIPLYVDDDDYAVDRRLSWQPRNDGLILAPEITPKND
ncbi:MAG TPA: ABC transporter substrate-binding protein [Thermoanaerobaculia bacterium]|nr:ABC transporter substrate-binding protein [Thermoanaerobaculia bacterium]